MEEAFGGFFCDFSFPQPIFIGDSDSARRAHPADRPRQAGDPRDGNGSLQRRGISENIGQIERAAAGACAGGICPHRPDWIFCRLVRKSCGAIRAKRGFCDSLTKKKLEMIAIGFLEWRRDQGRIADPESGSGSSFPQKDHESRGIDRGYWEMIAGERVWLAPGLSCSAKLDRFLAGKFFTDRPGGRGRRGHDQAISEKSGKIPVMQFLAAEQRSATCARPIGSGNSCALQVYSFGDNARECISFLQIVHQSLTILGFNFRIRLFGKKRKAQSV